MNLAQISSIIFNIITTILISEGLNNVKPLAYHVIPVHCDIQLTALLSNVSCNESKKGSEYVHFEGTTGIIINILYSTNIIKFHTLNIHINQLSVRLIETNGIVHYVNEILHSSEENISTFYFYNLLSPGFYTLKINSTSCITEYDTGLFFGSNYSKRNNNLIWLITPHNQMTGTCQLFPCWNEPQLKNTFTISIKHDSDLKVLSNMRIYYTSTNNDSTWTIFRTTPPISIYKISIIVTNFPSIRINANVTLWCEKCKKLGLSLKYAKQIIKNITLHLESQFDEIEIPKIDHVLISNFPNNSISKWGLIFHRKADLIYDEKSDPVMRKIEITRSIASKIAYQWFGNAVTPTCWLYFRLNNGLATLFGEEATIKIFNNSQLMDFFIVRSQYDFLLLDFNLNLLQINSTSQIISIFNFLGYTKVPTDLWMLQNIITDVAFRKNVCAYLYKHMFISVITDEFWSIRKDVANAPYQYFKSNDFLTWITYNISYCPSLNLEHGNYFLGDLMQYFNTTDDGYYELSKNWHKIAHLDIEKYKNLSVVNRAKIINVAFHLMMSGQLNVSTFWNITKYSSQEINYSVWYPMIKVFEYISSVFPLSKEEVNFILIKEKIRELLSTSLETLGFDERPMENDLTKCLRQEIAKWACIVEHSECLLKAKFKLEQHLEHPKLYKILPGWKSWTYCKGLMMVDSPSWSYIRYIWSNKPNRKYVEFLTCFQHYHFLNMLFDFLELESRRQTATEEDVNTCIKIFHSVVANYAKNDYALQIMLSSFIYIKPMKISETVALVDIINHVYSAKQLYKIRDMLKYNKMVYLEVTLKSKIYNKIETRLSEIERQINHFRVFLN